VQQGGQLQAIFYCAQNKYKSVETKTFWNNIKIAKTGALGLCGWVGMVMVWERGKGKGTSRGQGLRRRWRRRRGRRLLATVLLFV